MSKPNTIYRPHTRFSKGFVQIWVHLANKNEKLVWAIQTSLLILHVMVFVYELIGKTTYLYPMCGITDNIVKIVDVVKDVLMALTNVVGLICLGDFILYLSKGFSIQPKTNYLAKCKTDILMVIFVLLTFVISAMHVFYFACNMGCWIAFRYILPGKIEYIYSNFAIFFILHLAQIAKDLTEDINEYLRTSVCPYFEGNSVYFVRIEMKKSPNNLKHMQKDITDCCGILQEITRHHEKVCDLLDKINETFKSVLVLIIVSVTFNILWNITMIFQFATKSTNVLQNNYIFVAFPMMLLVEGGQGGLVACIGEQIEKQAHQTTKICYSLLNKIPNSIPRDQQDSIEKQLKIFMDQTQVRKVYLHAGGFFKLNWGILSSVASTVVTYSIILIQFLFKGSSRQTTILPTKTRNRTKIERRNYAKKKGPLKSVQSPTIVSTYINSHNTSR